VPAWTFRCARRFRSPTRSPGSSSALKRRRPLVRGESGRRPPWLEPQGGDHRWRENMWGAIVELHGRYPRALAALKGEWWTDASRTETLCALVIWRARSTMSAMTRVRSSTSTLSSLTTPVRAPGRWRSYEGLEADDAASRVGHVGHEPKGGVNEEPRLGPAATQVSRKSHSSPMTHRSAESLPFNIPHSKSL
jgi:hypothetical protein